MSQEATTFERIHREIRERLEYLRPLIEEVPLFEAALEAMGGEVVRAAPRRGEDRKQWTRLTDEQLRDFMVNRTEGVPPKELAEHFGVSSGTIRNAMYRLQHLGIVKRSGEGVHVRWTYNDKLPAGPRERPVHDRPTHRTNEAMPVTGTGRPWTPVGTERPPTGGKRIGPRPKTGT
jgi:Bacterial regulatory proteins, gntR family